MANYMCVTRSNYFSVNNKEAFEAFMARVYGSDENVEVWNDGDKYAFGCYGSISGLRSDDSEEYDEDEETYDAFIDGLQSFVSDGDAIILSEVGFEKLRYLVGLATIITRADCKTITIGGQAMQVAREMLGDANWATRNDY